MKVLKKCKLSKKEQKKENEVSRKTWDISPVTRVVKDKTKYSRKQKHPGKHSEE